MAKKRKVAAPAKVKAPAKRAAPPAKVKAPAKAKPPYAEDLARLKKIGEHQAKIAELAAELETISPDGFYIFYPNVYQAAVDTLELAKVYTASVAARRAEGRRTQARFKRGSG